MSKLWIYGALLLNSTVNTALLQSDYFLTMIEDEMVPLASGDIVEKYRFFPYALLIMIMLLTGVLITAYYIKCMQYRRRYVALGGSPKLSRWEWRLKKLKEMSVEMEWNIKAE